MSPQARLLTALEPFLPPTGAITRPERPLRLLYWRWPPIGPYNGFTGAERIRGWQAMHLLLQAGALAKDTSCSGCGSRHELAFHSETYFHPAEHVTVCKPCHIQLHRRFKNPDAFRAYRDRAREQHGGPTLLDVLPMEPLDLAGWYRLHGIDDLQWPDGFASILATHPIIGRWHVGPEERPHTPDLFA